MQTDNDENLLQALEEDGELTAEDMGLGGSPAVDYESHAAPTAFDSKQTSPAINAGDRNAPFEGRVTEQSRKPVGDARGTLSQDLSVSYAPLIQRLSRKTQVTSLQPEQPIVELTAEPEFVYQPQVRPPPGILDHGTIVYGTGRACERAGELSTNQGQIGQSVMEQLYGLRGGAEAGRAGEHCPPEQVPPSLPASVAPLAGGRCAQDQEQEQHKTVDARGVDRYGEPGLRSYVMPLDPKDQQQDEDEAEDQDEGGGEDVKEGARKQGDELDGGLDGVCWPHTQSSASGAGTHDGPIGSTKSPRERAGSTNNVAGVTTDVLGRTVDEHRSGEGAAGSRTDPRQLGDGLGPMEPDAALQGAEQVLGRIHNILTGNTPEARARAAERERVASQRREMRAAQQKERKEVRDRQKAARDAARAARTPGNPEGADASP